MAAEDEEKADSTAESARVLVDAIQAQRLPRDILTRKAFENAIAVANAIGGSTNAVIHLLAIAGRMGVDLTLDDWDRFGRDVPTIVDLHPGAEAMEREAYDMFGITFDGHPDHTRILMPENWVGYPLRKDFSMGRIPVQFKAPEGR